MTAAVAAATARSASQWRDRRVSARDGLLLHLRDYGERLSPWLPVVCLPGLTRNAADFHDLAAYLSTHRHRPRRVLALDLRGRGLSGHDRDWRNYTPLTEAGDVLDVMTACGVERACFVGTSRGGIVTMMLTAMRPTAIAAAVLNDVGPVIEGAGLLRIKNTLQATHAPRSWEEASGLLQRAYERSFPGIDADGWMAFARKTYLERDGKPALAYDPKLLKTLSSIDFDQPLASLWPQFEGLRNIPALAIRGKNSDILSAETLAQMRECKPDLEVMEVPDAGHAPHLASPAELTRISGFVTAVEDGKFHSSSPR